MRVGFPAAGVGVWQARRGMQFSVEAWSPEYGIAADGDRLEETDADVRLDVESDPADWRPISPAPTATGQPPLVFVDGVRRIDARIWIHDGNRAHSGVCATVAAGSVICNGEAFIDEVRIHRGLYAPPDAEAGPVETRYATYHYVATASSDPESIYLAIHEQMTRVETEIIPDNYPDSMIVFDGPLRGRTHPRAVGYVKTQHVHYLPPDLMPILGQLDDGQRSPLLLIGGRANRYSWYLRLPGPRTQPLAGIVRLELPGVHTAAEAIERADAISARLPRFASEPHKEARAPHNLYPIAGLEQQLRRRLGDPHLLERGLRHTAHHQPTPAPHL